MSTPRFLRLASALALAGLVGCADDSERRFGFGDCNGGGCFGCTDDSQRSCWPLPYDPCDAAHRCPDGAICTNIGCAKACTADTDCRQGEVCTAGGYCAPGVARTYPVEPGTAVPCGADSPCGGGYLCQGGFCTHPASCGIPVTLCTVDAECGSGRACRQGTCHALCPEGLCPVGQTCSAGACVDATPASPQCLFDLDCGPASRCIDATCHPLCAGDAQCRTHEFCDAGVCRADVRATASTPR